MALVTVAGAGRIVTGRAFLNGRLLRVSRANKVLTNFVIGRKFLGRSQTWTMQNVLTAIASSPFHQGHCQRFVDGTLAPQVVAAMAVACEVVHH